MRIYVNQLDAWWGLNEKEWQTVVREALANDGAYTLPEHRIVRHQPNRVHSTVVDGKRNYHIKADATRTARIVQPLDQPIEWFEQELVPPVHNSGSSSQTGSR